MAITDSAHPAHPHEIDFVSKLNETLRSIKKDYHAQAKELKLNRVNLETTRETDNAILTNYLGGPDNGLKALGDPGLVNDGFSDYNTLRDINKDVFKINIMSQNVSTLASQTSDYTKDITLKTASAVKLIDTAHISVARLTSFVASIHAKLNTEEKGSPLATLSAAAFEDTQNAALSAEYTSVHSVTVTESVAKSHATSVFAIISQAAVESGLLAETLSTSVLAAGINAATVYQESLDEQVTLEKDDAQLTEEDTEHLTVTLIGGTGEYAFLYKEIIPKQRLRKPHTESDSVEKYIDEAAEGKGLVPLQKITAKTTESEKYVKSHSQANTI